MFGEVVRGQRRRLQLTQEALAARSGLGVRSIREIERGRGARPQARTVELLADAFGLGGEQRAVFRSAATGVGSGNLPAETSSFVGRDDLVAELAAAVADSRLVTLVGVAGVGKTRLARRIAAEVAPAHPGGAWLVDVGAERDAARLPRAVAEALGKVDLGTSDVLAGVTAHLGTGRALLVLDNCEHLVAGCAEVCAALLAGAPELRVLVTSRQALAVTGEHVVHVPPLATGGPTGPRDDALTLFADRAATAAGFELTDSTRPAAEELCRRLDGLPLAIELAAVRLRALTLDDVLADTGTLLHADGSRDGRHRTLTSAIGWSWDLCSPAERLLWSRASVFAGDFDLDAAQSVAGDGEPVLPAVVGLVEKSVLLAIGHDGTDSGSTRFRLLTPLRQFGSERLAADGDLVPRRDRHLHWYAGLAARAQADSCTSRQVSWQARLLAERADLRAALDHALTTPDRQAAGLALIADLRDHWITGSRLGEARYWLDRALGAPGAVAAAPVTVLWLAAAVAVLQGDLGAARRWLAEGTALAEARDDAEAKAYLSFVAAAATMAAGDVPASVPELRRARTALAGMARPDAVALSAPFMIALVELIAGDAAAALTESDRGRRVGEALGESWALSCCLWVAALAHWSRGELGAAGATARECLALKRSLDDGLGLAITVELLAWIAAAAGDAEHAVVVRGAAERLWNAVGTAWFGVPQLLAIRRGSDDATRQALGDAAFAAALDRGAALPREAALDVALEPAPR